MKIFNISVQTSAAIQFNFLNWSAWHAKQKAMHSVRRKCFTVLLLGGASEYVARGKNSVKIFPYKFDDWP